jgi:Protein of unknown function (DUF3306)
MSEPGDRAENFLQRWSQRKRAAKARPPDEAKPVEAATADAGAPPGDTTTPAFDLPTFDPATLPPIESITATSDIRAFLAPGVPEEVSRAALRRAWSADPAIRDFIGLAENQWDFTQPDSIPGFGSLELTPEIRRMVAQLFGDAPQSPPSQQSASSETNESIAENAAERPPPMTPDPVAIPAADSARASEDCLQPQLVLRSSNSAATQPSHDVEESPQPAERKHGGALPR